MDGNDPPQSNLPPCFFDVELRDFGSAAPPRKVKMLASPSLTLSDFMCLVYKQHVVPKPSQANRRTSADLPLDSDDEDSTSDAIYKAGLDVFLDSIQSILCGDTSLEAFLGYEQATLQNLESPATSIKRFGLMINYRTPGIHVDSLPNNKSDKPPINAFSVMMENARVRIQFLEIPSLEEDSNLQQQILHQLCTFFQVKKVGYTNDQQKELLNKNLHITASTLCFVHKHWNKLFRKEFPLFPNTISDILKLLINCKRKVDISEG